MSEEMTDSPSIVLPMQRKAICRKTAKTAKIIFIFIRQKRQHSMKSENEQQLRKKETKNNT